jgi:hypothetical protein
VPFKHIYTGQEVRVPLALPDSTPVIEHVRQRIVYNYGSYSVTVRFLPDGGVEVIYSTGLMRAIAFPPASPVPATGSAPLAPPYTSLTK